MAIRTAPTGGGVMAALRRDDPAAVPASTRHCCPECLPPSTPVGRRLRSWKAPWCRLAPRVGVADAVAFHEPIHQSMAEPFTAAGG